MFRSLAILLAYRSVEAADAGWIFRPSMVIEGAGAANSPSPQLRFRTSAQGYIRRHDMEWPPVPWKRLHALYRSACRSVG